MVVNENEIIWAKIKENAIIPTKNDEDAGMDIYACFDEDYVLIHPFCTKLIPTGLACALNQKYYLQLEERGSTGSKGIKRSAGVVDSGYRGEIFVALTNCNDKLLIISKLEKNELLMKYDSLCLLDDDIIIYPYSKAICQGIIHHVINLQPKEVSYNELKQYVSIRGDGNLGASGK